jgi:adenylate cyclase
MRLSPLDQDREYFLCGLASTHNSKGEFEQALPYAQRAVQEMTTFTTSNMTLIRSLVGLNRLDEARAAAQKLLEIQPTFTVSHYRVVTPLKSLAEIERNIDAFRRAGLPE